MRAVILKYIWIIFFSLFVLSRFIFLDADPSIFKDYGDLSDEGWWSNIPQNKINYGEWFTKSYDGGFNMAPLSTLIIFFFFKILGPSLFTIKLYSTLSFIILLFLLNKSLISLNQRSKDLILFLTSCSFYLFDFSRIGHLELPSLPYLLLFLIGIQQKNKYQPIIAGFSLALLYFSKLSFIYFLPVGALIYIITIYNESNRRFKLTSFFTALIVPITIGTIMINNLLPETPQMTNWIKKEHLPSILESFHIGTILHRTGSLTRIELFHYPETFLLISSVGIYFFKKNLLATRSLNDLKNTFSTIEIFAVSTLIFYTLTNLFSDFMNRRFLILILPLIILSSLGTEKVHPVKGTKNTLLLYLVGGALFLSLIRFFPNHEYLILKSTIIFLFSLFVLEKWVINRWNFSKIILPLGFIIFISACLCNYANWILDNGPYIILTSSIVLIGTLITRRLKHLIPFLYIGVSAFCFFKYFSNIEYTIKNNTEHLSTSLEKGSWIIGQDWIMSIGLETNTRPVYHSLDYLENGAPGLNYSKELKPKYLFWREESYRSFEEIKSKNNLIERVLGAKLEYKECQTWFHKKFKTHRYEIIYQN